MLQINLTSQIILVWEKNKKIWVLQLGVALSNFGASIHYFDHIPRTLVTVVRRNLETGKLPPV